MSKAIKLIWATDSEIRLIKNKRLEKIIIFTNIISLLLYCLGRKDFALRFALFGLKITAILRIIYFLVLILTAIFF